MSTIKQDRLDLEKLLNGIDPVERGAGGVTNTGVAYSPAVSPAAVVDNPSTQESLEQRIFAYDYESSKKGLRKRARKTIIGIIRHVIADERMLEDDYIKDKMEQDIDILADLYSQQDANEVMRKGLIDMVSRGNVAPRNFEVYTQMTAQAQAINKQIVDTEQRLRKTYLDLKYEIQDRLQEKQSLPGVGMQQSLTGGDGSVLVTSPKNLLSDVKAKHLEKLKNMESVKTIE